jgi:hypothetical protein
MIDAGHLQLSRCTLAQRRPLIDGRKIHTSTAVNVVFYSAIALLIAPALTRSCFPSAGVSSGAAPAN